MKKKRYIITTILVVLLCSFGVTGCKNNMDAKTQNTKQSKTEPKKEARVTPEAQNQIDKTDETQSMPQEEKVLCSLATRKAYAEIVCEMVTNNYYPEDGSFMSQNDEDKYDEYGDEIVDTNKMIWIDTEKEDLDKTSLWTIADVDQDGQEELLFDFPATNSSFSGGQIVYGYDYPQNKIYIKKMDLHNEVVKNAVSGEKINPPQCKTIIKQYIKYLINQVDKNGKDKNEKLDVGLMFLNKPKSKLVENKLKKMKFQIKKHVSDGYITSYSCLFKNKEYLYTMHEDGEVVVYLKKFPGISLCGVKPGMKLDAILDTIKSYGFCYVDDSENTGIPDGYRIYVTTGRANGNYMISILIDKKKVIEIGISKMDGLE